MTAQNINFEELVDLHAEEIFSYLWRLLGENKAAEDRLQSTFQKAIQEFQNLDDKADVRIWLYAHATKEGRAYWKERKKLESSGIARKKKSSSFRAAVQKLPYNQFATLLMRKYQNLNYKEIGAAMHFTESAARSSVYRALKRLPKLLKEQD
ncbi:MAG: sigma-70 family RNA polymerase sigma factor [Chloroflexi bacterium]|nr:sigma-70 family RNA polymerase sigma factor [Chloroflexota bacterium]